MGKSKALLFGINYLGTKSALRGCVNDVNNMANFLRTYAGFDDIQIYTDEHDSSQVTGDAIVEHIRKLAVESVSDGIERVWIHYSGHGGQLRDRSGDEKEDRMDECILPADFAQNGVITDDFVKKLLRMFDEDTKVTCVFDCCHSGTICDLKYAYSNYGQSTVNCLSSLCKADVCVISGCMDEQTSADAYNVRGMRAFSGAMTSCLLEVMRFDITSTKVIDELNKKLRSKGFKQIAQLSTSKPPTSERRLY